jgi:anti-anti-sigma factor
MNIRASRPEGSSSVAVISLEGKLDSSNYTGFIHAAQGLFDDGLRNLVIDMRGLEYMSSAGLMALHTVARMFGKSRDGQEETANSYRSIDQKADQTIQQHVRLVGLQPPVLGVLQTAGLSQFFGAFNDLDVALKSFGK